MCTKFQVDWTSVSSKTTLTKNFNLKWDERTDGRTNRRTDGKTHRPENIMPLYYGRWGIIKETRSTYEPYQQTTTTEQQAADLGQVHKNAVTLNV